MTIQALRKVDAVWARSAEEDRDALAVLNAYIDSYYDDKTFHDGSVNVGYFSTTEQTFNSYVIYAEEALKERDFYQSLCTNGFSSDLCTLPYLDNVPADASTTALASRAARGELALSAALPDDDPRQADLRSSGYFKAVLSGDTSLLGETLERDGSYLHNYFTTEAFKAMTKHVDLDEQNRQDFLDIAEAKAALAETFIITLNHYPDHPLSQQIASETTAWQDDPLGWLSLNPVTARIDSILHGRNDPTDTLVVSLAELAMGYGLGRALEPIGAALNAKIAPVLTRIGTGTKETLSQIGSGAYHWLTKTVYEAKGLIRPVNISALPTKLPTTTSSGIKIVANPNKTTTILGRFNDDMDRIINTELNYPKTLDFGAKKGSFNVLNAPNQFWKNPDQFWQEFNKPFLDKAVARGGDIVLATEPILEFRVSAPSGADFFARGAIFFLTARPFCGRAFASKGAQSKEDQLPSVVSDALPSCDCRSDGSVPLADCPGPCRSRPLRYDLPRTPDRGHDHG